MSAPTTAPPAGARTIAELLADARSRIGRVTPVQAATRVARGALLVDIRAAAQRAREGEVPGALVVERNVLEWRFDPTSDARLPEATGDDVEVVVLCSEGYTASLPADALRSLELTRAVDVSRRRRRASGAARRRARPGRAGAAGRWPRWPRS